jgi:hypothetical protein
LPLSQTDLPGSSVPSHQKYRPLGPQGDVDKKYSITYSFSKKNLKNICSYFQPENIVCSGRNGESIKIIDFGTAMQLTSGQQGQLFLIIFSQ